MSCLRVSLSCWFSVFTALALTVVACDGPRAHAPSIDAGLVVRNDHDGPATAQTDPSSDARSAGGLDAPGASPPGSPDAASISSPGQPPVSPSADAAASSTADAGSTPATVCGNMIVEAGEECDPPGSCPASCPNRGCTKFMLVGDPAKCTARCVEMGAETRCVANDGCCPSTCNATTDGDCAVKCDNGVREGKETCDPLATCPTACPPQGCQLRKLVNGGSCTAECVNDRQQSACTSGDGCCPAACNHNDDTDCPPCGASGQICCGGTCNGPMLSCQGGRCNACGSSGQVCCPGNSCAGGLTCDGGKCAVPCGDDGQACCSGACNNAGLVCASSRCRVCGGSAQPCCGGNRCNGASLSCQGGQCSACGGNGQACCDSGCSGGLDCRGGKCQPPCGHDGEVCCSGTCLGALACNGSGRCQVKLADGTSCRGVSASLCQSGNCVDNVCCRSGSCSTCSKCGSSGTCEPLSAGSTPAGCTGAQACDGAGNCKTTLLPNGSMCFDASGNPQDSKCASSYCGRDSICHNCGDLKENCCTSGRQACSGGLRCNNGCANNVLSPGDKDSKCLPPDEIPPTECIVFP
jgi:hypothetical protein